MLPILYVVVPCYNEEKVLPITNKLFIEKIDFLVKNKKISNKSRVLYVNDGSKDTTWNLIEEYSNAYKEVEGISLSRNRGHQNALLGGLMESRNYADITISIDCDGQDDINAMDEMIDNYSKGYEIVYGVRSKRETDTFFKRFTAEAFYKLLNSMGVETIYNHADYRLVSSKVLNEFSNYNEVNLFLRGMFPLVGYASTSVYYERSKRMAGESHYPLSKMLSLAFDGITSLSIKPILYIMLFGCILSFLSIIGIILSLIIKFNLYIQWTMLFILSFIFGLLFISLGIVGEYVGKTYLETKHRPRYIISKKTYKS